MPRKPLIQSTLNFLGGTLLGVSVALLLSFNALLLWVATGPRNIDMLTPFIEVSLTDSAHNYSVKIGESWLIWDGWKHPIDIRLRNVSVMTKEQQRFSRFPEISVGMDVFEMLRGNLLPSSLTISHPVLSLYQNEDRSISFGFRPQGEEGEAAPPAPEPEASVPFAVVLSQLVDPDERSPLRKLRTVTILNADVSVGNKRSGVFFTARDANLVFKNNRKGTQAFGSAVIAYGEEQSRIDTSFTLPRGEPIVSGEVNFGPILPGTLADLFTSKTEISALKFPMRGQVKMEVERSGRLQSLDFALDGGKGTVETERLASALPVTSLHAEGTLTGGGTDIAIRNLSLDLGGMLLEASGTATIAGDQTAVQAHVVGKNIPNDMLHMLWPLGVAPLSRDWITKNIYSGTYTEAVADINIKPGDIALPVLPQEAVDANIQLQDAKISYLPEHPEVSDVKATIHVDGLSLEARIEHGRYMRDTSVSNGTVKIADLNEDNPYIELAFDAKSSGRDIVKFLGLPRLNHAKRLSLSEDAAEGTATGRAELGFHFFDEGDDDIKYNITAEGKELSQPNLLGKFDIRKASGTVALDNRRIEFKGAGQVNGADAHEATVTYLFEPEDGYDTFIDTTATTPVSALPRFGYPDLAFMKGRLGVKASLKIGDTKEKATATLNLAQSAIDFRPVRYVKPEGEPATLELTTEKNGGVTTIPSFRISGRELEGKGSAGLTADKSDLASVRFESLAYGKTRLASLLYEKLDGGFALNARGEAADLSPWFAGEEREGEGFSFQHFPVVKLDADVKRLILGEGRELAALRGKLDCGKERCNSADIDGATLDGKPFEFRILKNPKGKRQVSLRAESAGAFLKAISVFDSMEGGHLTLTGTYAEKSGHSLLTGRADISSYTVKDAPVLAKILSLASLTGFFDTLVGKGIHFSKLRAPFTLSKDVITVKEAKTHGDAMGMTIDGSITFPQRKLDLHGTIVPSYSLNTVLGKVPLIGAALMGGEGKGVFAASYSIKGVGSAPEVSVNPLSILTPGFLRGLFDIFDAPAKTEEEDDDDDEE